VIINSINIFLFFVYTFGLGYSLTRFQPFGGPITLISRIGIGLGAWVVLGIFLNFLHIPLDWRIFLAIALIPIAWDHFKKRIRPSWPSEIKKRDLVLLFLIFAFCLYIYTIGPFKYPWLEDDDSWAHAAGIKYVAVERNLNVPKGDFHYINPYPPGYDFILGMMHQTNPSLYWTLKFFNGFIIALGYLFFYIFAKEFTKNEGKGLVATFFLAAIPCYLTHFIWAHSLAVTLFFPAFYCLSKIHEDKRFMFPASVVIAAIFMATPTKSIKFIIFVLLWITAFGLIHKKIWKEAFIVLILGGFLSLPWWAPVIKDIWIEKNSAILIRNENQIYNTRVDPLTLSDSFFSPRGGSATRSYTFADYFYANVMKGTKINCFIGVGQIICSLGILGFLTLLFRFKRGKKDEQVYTLTIILWLIFTFLGMNSATFNLPIGLFAFRFWILFAIPTVFLATEAFYLVTVWIKQQKIKYITSIILIAATAVTSAHPKIALNTSLWDFGVYWTSLDGLLGHVSLRYQLKPNTKVFSFTDNLLVIGADMYVDFWRGKYKNDLTNAINLSAEDLHEALKDDHFEYLIIGERDYLKYGEAAMEEKLQKILQNNSYRLFYTYKNIFWVIKIV